MPKLKTTAKDKKTETLAKATRIIFLIAAVLFIGSGWFWWRNIASSPKKVFYDMLDNNLRSRGGARRVEQSNGGQKLEQTLQVQNGAQNIVRSSTILSQGEAGATKVTTESIGTPSEDYIRYVDITTDQKGKDGKDFDFSNVLGTWGKSSPAAEGLQPAGQLYSEAVLGVVPTGYVAPEARQQLLKLIREQNVYDIDFSSVKRETKGGRPRYIYSAKVDPEKYVTMLKQFGSVVGLKQLETFDPSSFRDSPPLQFDLEVDVWSRQLTHLNFTGSERKESYSSYGIESLVSFPENSIPVEELQQRLQSLQ